MNKIVLLGRLTKDPDVRYTNSGRCVTQITLAVNRPYSGQDGQREADFIPVVIWGNAAEAVGNYVHKGQRLLVEGRLQIRSYESKGQKFWRTEVIADKAEFIELKSKNEQPKQQEPAADSAGGFEAMGQAVPFDDEIPF